MRIGLQIPSFTWPGGPAKIHEHLAQIARTADDGGFYSLWVMDHFFQIGAVGPVENEMLEGYTALGYLAGLTKKVKLGTMVTGVIYRNPGILAKTVSTLDVLSNGRAYLGIGAAWNERESLGLGVRFPPVKERFEMLEEALQIIQQMWAEKVSPYNGKHYQLAETLNHPQPLAKPHPPILIGGTGEKKTLRFVAKYADACNLFARLGNDALKAKLNILKKHCEEVGRPYDQIEKTSLDTARLVEGQTAREIIDECRTLADMGFSHAIFNMPGVETIKPLETFAREIIPAVKDF